MFEVNLFGVMRMVQEFAPLLIASGDGRIVNIGSITGVMPYPFGSTYNASKAALHSYGNTLRLELAPFKQVQLIFYTSANIITVFKLSLCEKLPRKSPQWLNF
jgi:short-subunit dehydrogenase